MIIKNGKVFTPDGKFTVTDIAFEDTFTAVGSTGAPADLDAAGKYIVPGFIDVHTHGAVTEDASDGSAEGLTKMSRYYADHGVTSWCPTTMTLKEPVLEQAMHAIRDFKSEGARCAGVNLEGPFLCYAKRGAQAAENLHAPDVEMFKRLNEASGNQIRLVTVACEEPGAMEFIEEVSKLCTVSLGHTVANYDQAMEGFRRGASHTTHLFNGMNPLHHRDPAVVGAAYDSGATVELICDGLHIHPAVIRMMFQLYGEKLVLISDSLRCAGMPDGEYTLGGQPIEMKNGKATLKGSDTLAGSSISVLHAVQNVVRFGVELEKAVYAATAAPAKVIGMEEKIGSIAVGKYADFLILDENLNLEAVYIGGKRYK
jgi:N-acetylglucosamine-6-phosphate deacetylase